MSFRVEDACKRTAELRMQLVADNEGELAVVFDDKEDRWDPDVDHIRTEVLSTARRNAEGEDEQGTIEPFQLP